MPLAQTEAKICTLEALISSTKDYISALSAQTSITRDLALHSESVNNDKTSRFKKALGVCSSFVEYRKDEAREYERQISKANKLIPGYEQELQRHLHEYVSSTDQEYQVLERIAGEMALVRLGTDNIIAHIQEVIVSGTTGSDTYNIKEVKRNKVNYGKLIERYNILIHKLGSKYEDISPVGIDQNFNYSFSNSSSNELELRDFNDSLTEVRDALERQANACQDRMSGKMQNAREQFAAKRQE